MVMTQNEYEQKKRECWDEFRIKNPAFNDMLGRKIFNQIFDRSYALGKQEKNVDTVIRGWVARDKGRFLGLYPWQPKRGDVAWVCGSCMVLPINTFPDLTWDGDPIEVELIIKRKKNG